MTHMQIGLIALELAAAHFAEGDTRTVVGIDIRRNLKDKAREFLLLRLYVTLLSLCRTRTRSYLHKAIQQLLHTKVIQGRAEEYRSHLSRTVGFHIELRIDAIHEFKILAEFGSIILSYPFI